MKAQGLILKIYDMNSRIVISNGIKKTYYDSVKDIIKNKLPMDNGLFSLFVKIFHNSNQTAVLKDSKNVNPSLGDFENMLLNLMSDDAKLILVTQDTRILKNLKECGISTNCILTPAESLELLNKIDLENMTLS